MFVYHDNRLDKDRYNDESIWSINPAVICRGQTIISDEGSKYDVDAEILLTTPDTETRTDYASHGSYDHYSSSSTIPGATNKIVIKMEVSKAYGAYGAEHKGAVNLIMSNAIHYMAQAIKEKGSNAFFAISEMEKYAKYEWINEQFRDLLKVTGIEFK